MSLINESYFVGGLTIAQLSQEAVSLDVQWYIDKYEPLFLRESLGYAFSKLMLDNPTEQRFIDLLEGSEYTYNDVERYFDGLANETTLQSPIANYVFYQYVKQQIEQQVGLGTVQPKAENATVVIPEYTLIRVYNEMVEMIRNMHLFLKANATVYPEYVQCQTKYIDELNHYF